MVYYDENIKAKLKDLAKKYYMATDHAHMEDHINAVIERAIDMTNWLLEMTEIGVNDDVIPEVNEGDIDLDVLIAITTLHDIGGAIDREHHNTVSANIFMKDPEFDIFNFTKDQKLKIMYGIIQHSSHFAGEYNSLEAEIMASADRDKPDVYDILYRSVEYSKKHNSDDPVASTVEYNCNRYSSVESKDYHVPMWHYRYWESTLGYDVFKGIHKFFKNEKAVTKTCQMINDGDDKDTVKKYITSVMSDNEITNKQYTESINKLYEGGRVL